MGRKVGTTKELLIVRSFNFSLWQSDSEHRKLEKMAYMQGLTMSDFIRQALEHEYKRILNEEVRQYEHSGVHSEIHKEPRKPDLDGAERSWTDRDGDTYR